jgi:hypothetical protein
MGPDGRRRVDLTKLPAWARTVIALATAVAVGGLALSVAAPHTGPVVPASAIVAALLAFAFVAWQSRKQR